MEILLMSFGIYLMLLNCVFVKMIDELFLDDIISNAIGKLIELFKVVFKWLKKKALKTKLRSI